MANSPLLFGPTGPININAPQAGALVSDAAGNITSQATSNGQLLIGNGAGSTAATLTQGANITITNGAGTITIASSGGGGGSQPLYPITAESTSFTAGSTTSGSMYVMAAGSAITATLPQASVAGNGFVVILTKSGATGNLSNYPIAVHSGDAINYNQTTVTTLGLSTAGESWTLVSDGSTTWNVENHQTSTNWSSTTTNTFTATTTTPTKGTVTLDSMIWRRVGNNAEVWVQYSQTASGGVAGSGDYILAMPSALAIDSGLVHFYTTVIGNTGTIPASTGALPAGVFSSSAGGSLTCHALPYDSTHFRVYITTNFGAWCSAANGNLSQAMAVSIKFMVPIANWFG